DNGGNSDEVVIPDGTVNINFATNQVTNVVGGPVNLTGVENLTVNGSDGVADAYVVNNYGAPTDVVNLVLNGGDTNNNDGDTIDLSLTDGPDTLVYTPSGVSAATISRVQGGPAITITGFNNVA